eukprot:scaffold26160_cov39-Tisochrysis_lutea.AAC.6
MSMNFELPHYHLITHRPPLRSQLPNGCGRHRAGVRKRRRSRCERRSWRWWRRARLDGVQDSKELQDEKEEEEEEGTAIDEREKDETTNERTTEDGKSGAAAGISSSPTLNVK